MFKLELVPERYKYGSAALLTYSYARCVDYLVTSFTADLPYPYMIAKSEDQAYAYAILMADQLALDTVTVLKIDKYSKGVSMFSIYPVEGEFIKDSRPDYDSPLPIHQGWIMYNGKEYQLVKKKKES